VSCRFIGYPEKFKRFCFYCLDRHIKFIETRHVVFLENEMMKGSTVSQEISLEEKRVYVPTPMQIPHAYTTRNLEIHGISISS
jgi:hypothetical protein